MHRSSLCRGAVGLLSLVAALEAAPGPEPRLRDEILSVLAKAPKPAAADRLRELTLILVADTKDHGQDEHDYPLWQKRWSVLLGGRPTTHSETHVNLYGLLPPATGAEDLAGAPRVKVATAWQWPSKDQFSSADLIVAFCYLAWDESRFKEIEAYLARGGGLVLIHSATWTLPGPHLQLASLAGVGGFTQYRHGPIALRMAADHPICLGLPELVRFTDETYWPPTPATIPSRIRVLATSEEKTGNGSDAVGAQPIFWTYEPGKGRVFGCVPGHYTWTFDDPYFRLLLLRGMAWSAGESPYRFDPLVLRGARVVP